MWGVWYAGGEVENRNRAASAKQVGAEKGMSELFRFTFLMRSQGAGVVGKAGLQCDATLKCETDRSGGRVRKQWKGRDDEQGCRRCKQITRSF